jgi:hypothetical protein
MNDHDQDRPIMRRYPAFALAALLFLLAVLIGSWVYLDNFPWPGTTDASDTAVDDLADRANVELRDQGAFEGGDGDSAKEPDPELPGRRQPLETPGRVVRRLPPVTVKTDGEGVVDAAAAVDEIVVEVVPGVAAVSSGGDSTPDLQPFIISTLPEMKARGQAYERKGDNSQRECKVHAKSPLVAASSVVDQRQRIKQFSDCLVGRLIWPDLPAAQLKEVKDRELRQACVYLLDLPEFREIVTSDDGWFVLYLTPGLAKGLRDTGLDVAVHSPAFRLKGGAQSVRVKAEGAIELQLEAAPPFEVEVTVLPEAAVKSGVRVWLERLGEPWSPDFDDSLYMSANVPASGKLTFHVPEHYGTLSLGATGPGWHSGLPQGAGFNKKGKLGVTLTLIDQRCDYVSGSVMTGNDSLVKGARLVSTHFGTTTYSAPDGRFGMYVPFDSFQDSRQFIVTAGRCRPEAVPLEARANPTPGVEGTSPHGPWTARLAQRGEVWLELRDLVEKKPTHVWVNGSSIYIPDTADALPVKTELPWGAPLVDLSGVREGGYHWISNEAWHRAFLAYAAGEDVVLEPVPLAEAFKRR